MRTIITVIGLMMVVSCYALKIASIETPDADNQLQTPDDIRLPVKSKIQAGRVERHNVSNVNFSSPLFVIGDDAVSRDWLINHASQMKTLNALGLVTNIKSKTHLQQLEELAGLPLLPVNIDDLSELLQVTHYPYAFDSGVVWQ